MGAFFRSGDFPGSDFSSWDCLDTPEIEAQMVLNLCFPGISNKLHKTWSLVSDDYHPQPAEVIPNPNRNDDKIESSFELTDYSAEYTQNIISIMKLK